MWHASCAPHLNYCMFLQIRISKKPNRGGACACQIVGMSFAGHCMCNAAMDARRGTENDAETIRMQPSVIVRRVGKTAFQQKQYMRLELLSSHIHVYIYIYMYNC